MIEKPLCYKYSPAGQYKTFPGECFGGLLSPLQLALMHVIDNGVE